MADGILLRLTPRALPRRKAEETPTDPLHDPLTPPFPEAPLAEVIEWPGPVGRPKPAKPAPSPGPRLARVVTARRASRSADRYFDQELAPEQVPTEARRQLEVAVFCEETLLDVYSFVRNRPVAAGSSLCASVPMWGLGASFPLVTFEHGDCVVRVPDSAGLWVRHDDRLVTRPELEDLGVATREGPDGVQSVCMEMMDRVELRFGKMALVLRWTSPASLARLWFRWRGFSFGSFLAAAALAVAALILALSMTSTEGPLTENVGPKPRYFRSAVQSPSPALQHYLKRLAPEPPPAPGPQPEPMLESDAPGGFSDPTLP